MVISDVCIECFFIVFINLIFCDVLIGMVMNVKINFFNFDVYNVYFSIV